MDQPAQPSLHHLNEGPADGVGEVERSPNGDPGLGFTGMFKTPSPLRYENVNETLFEEEIDSDGELGSIADEFSDNEEPLPSRQLKAPPKMVLVNQHRPRSPHYPQMATMNLDNRLPLPIHLLYLLSL